MNENEDTLERDAFHPLHAEPPASLQPWLSVIAI